MSSNDERVRLYSREPEDARYTDAPENQGPDFVDALLAMRRMERDLEQITRDPSGLPGYEDLPDSVKAFAKTEPLRFWTSWQMARAGIDLAAMEELRIELQRQLDDALVMVGWDRTSPPTDEQLERAGEIIRQLLSE